MSSLSSAEVHRFLKSVAGSEPRCHRIPDPWYAAQCPVPVFMVARLSGVGVATIKYAIDGERHVAPRGRGRYSGWAEDGIGARTCQKLTPVIRAIEDGRLVFVRRGRAWDDIWLDEPPPRPPQSPMVDSSAWDYWRRCRQCCGRKWLPATIGGTAGVACYVCFPPSQYRSIGATPGDERLVLRVIKGLSSDHENRHHRALQRRA